MIQTCQGRHSPRVEDMIRNHICLRTALSRQLALATVPDGQFHTACVNQQQCDKRPNVRSYCGTVIAHTVSRGRWCFTYCYIWGQATSLQETHSSFCMMINIMTSSLYQKPRNDKGVLKHHIIQTQLLNMFNFSSNVYVRLMSLKYKTITRVLSTGKQQLK